MSERKESNNDRDQSTNEELVNGRWTARDGSDFHKTMRHEANWRYQRDNCPYDVECEFEVGLHDSNGNEVGYGFADLVIDDKYVIDYKTDQMTEWTEASARAKGHQYGSKIAGYANSPQMNDDAEGHLLMVGNRNHNERIESVFREAAAEHGVTVVFCDSGDPEMILNQIEDRFMPLERQRAADNDLTEMVATSRETSETRSYLNQVRLDTHDALSSVKSELSQKMDQTFASVETAWEGINVPSTPTASTGVSSFVLAPILYEALKQRVKDTTVGQWITEFVDNRKMDRDLEGINVVRQEALPNVAEEAIQSIEAASQPTIEPEPELTPVVDAALEYEPESTVQFEPDLDPEPRVEAVPDLDPTPRVAPEPDLPPVAETVMTVDIDPGNENEF